MDSLMLRFGRAMAALVLLAAVITTAAAAQAPAHGTYIVVLDPGVVNVRATADGLARAHGGQVGFVYEHALRGFSVRIPAQGAAGIARNPQVAYVEADQLFTISEQTVPTGIDRIFAPGNGNLDIDGTDDERIDVDVAIIDTGIDLDHPDLNVVGSTNCAGGGPFTSSCGSGGDDGNGHGTHVAGTVAAIDNATGVVGVAPGARLWAVRVLDNNGSGWTSWIVAGMDWVTARADIIEVANMSLGGGASDALDKAANDMAGAGVALAVAAGNSNADAKDYSPARAEKVLTVSALADFDGTDGGNGTSTCRTDQDDTLADFSNWGSTIEIAAPGVCILSTWLGGGYNTISGTSMASPHAAGGLALLASGATPTTDWTDVQNLYEVLTKAGNFNWVDDGGPNDTGDGKREPLLDVRNTSLFNPATVPGSGGGGGDTTPPAAPSSLTATAGSGSVSLDWADNTDDFVGYNVYRSTESGLGYEKLNTSSLVGSSHYNDTTVTNGTKYYYVVSAVDASNNESGNSNEASATPTSSSSGTTISLSSSSSSTGSSWTANVSVTTNNGAAVSWAWSNGTTGSGTCGSTPCTVTKTGIPKRTGSVTLTASSDGATTKSITVAKP
ncbi:MAG TPA: S8 family serine peptidase [Gaiellaceae bacterium]|nr:S8 family serine peptidase [Gaiellaceae bacterium]